MYVQDEVQASSLLQDLLASSEGSLTGDQVCKLHVEYDKCKKYSSDRMKTFREPGRKLVAGVVSDYRILGCHQGQRLLVFSVLDETKLCLLFEPECCDYGCLNLLGESKYQHKPIFIIEYLEPQPTVFSMVETVRTSKGRRKENVIDFTVEGDMHKTFNLNST